MNGYQVMNKKVWAMTKMTFYGKGQRYFMKDNLMR